MKGAVATIRRLHGCGLREGSPWGPHFTFCVCFSRGGHTFQHVVSRHVRCIWWHLDLVRYMMAVVCTAGVWTEASSW